MWTSRQNPPRTRLVVGFHAPGGVHELFPKQLLELLPIAIVDDDEALDLWMRIQIVLHFSRPVMRRSSLLARLVGDVTMKIVDAEVRIENVDGLPPTPIRADHDLGAEVFAQAPQSFDGIGIPVMGDRAKVVFVEVEVGGVVEAVGQTPPQLVQIVLETLLARRPLKYAVDVQEDHRAARCFLLH